MKVSELMKTDLKTVYDDVPVVDAIHAMVDAHVSGLPVVNRKGRLVGVVTASDILDEEAQREEPEARERFFEQILVNEIMSPRPEIISPHATVRDAAQRMLYLEGHRLFVETEGRLVGVISSTDIVQALATWGAKVGSDT